MCDGVIWKCQGGETERESEFCTLYPPIPELYIPLVTYPGVALGLMERMLYCVCAYVYVCVCASA